MEMSKLGRKLTTSALALASMAWPTSKPRSSVLWMRSLTFWTYCAESWSLSNVSTARTNRQARVGSVVWKRDSSMDVRIFR
ncbi:hypothetical protein EYF80_026756 [Liparis tanakae]|uniref:Uncharacterized protein n=1 Tax=Liparis tanakae TaxID=230148 RepID=A0A4Z2HAX4_9TELE|nr:hypothetical protein EYF80_026756 [Liparis tanakae]